MACASARLVFAVWLVLLAACAPRIYSTLHRGPWPAEMTQFWVEPDDIGSRDLFWGIGGRRYAPHPDAVFTFIEEKQGGFSPGYDVRGPDAREWKVKMGPESRTEVVASRLLWALGFHQPPIYYLSAWKLQGGPCPGVQAGGRFRPVLDSLEKGNDWSWHQNPFVGSRPYRGLLVLNVMLNNSDLKPDNNSVYRATGAWPHPGRWFVVRDLGHTFGRTGRIYGTRDDLEGFLEHRFVTRVEEDRVFFEWHGRHTELLESITPADVRWIGTLLAELADRQWIDAFRAGGYTREEAEPFIARMQEKIERARTLSGRCARPLSSC